MTNIGEQLVASYMQYIKGCEFIQTNLYTVDSQGEIDVVGINLIESKVYIAVISDRGMADEACWEAGGQCCMRRIITPPLLSVCADIAAERETLDSA